MTTKRCFAAAPGGHVGVRVGQAILGLWGVADYLLDAEFFY